MQKQNKRKFKTAILSFLLIGAMVATGIGAYFTATDTKTNVFTVGNVDIELQEPNWQNNYPTTPNETVKKDPQIKNIGDQDAYVYLTVDVPYATVVVADADGNKSAAAETELFSYTVNDNWVEVGTAEQVTADSVYRHVYAYVGSDATTLEALAATATTSALFEEIKFANVVETADTAVLADTSLDVVVNAYGIETNIIGSEATPDYVWDIITNQTIEGAASEKPVLLEGDGSTYNTFAVNDLRFRSSAPLDEFQQLEINGEVVDPKYYTTAEGSTIINLSGEYLATLEAGVNDIAVVSDSGEATGTFSGYSGIPEGCTYTVKATGEVLTGGDPLPAAPAKGDIYMTGDYEFHYLEGLDDGNVWTELTEEDIEELNSSEYGKFSNWFFAVRDQSKESYGELPSVLFGEPITNFTSVFAYCTNLKYAPELPSTASAMAGTFLGCTSLEEAPYIPENAILYRTFEDCSSLSSFVLRYGFTDVSKDVFKNCTSLRNIIIEDGLTFIPDRVFMDLTALTSITIPDSVTSIGLKAFEGCTSLKSINIPDSVTSIDNAFINCTNLVSVDLSNKITEITGDTFKGCSSLASIVIPDSVTSISSYAFKNCTSLSSVYLGDGVTNISEWAFEGCSNLNSIVIDENNMVYDSRDNSNAIIETETNTLILGSSNTIIPNSVTTIGSNAFKGCTGLKSIYIPKNVSSIIASAYGMSPFYKCSSSLIIYCAADSEQSGWGTYWNYYSKTGKLNVIYNSIKEPNLNIAGSYDSDGNLL